MDASLLVPDLIASSSIDGLTNIWDLRVPSDPSQTLYIDSSSIRNVKFSPLDANLLASTHGTRWRIWDLRNTSGPIVTTPAHSYRVNDISWHGSRRERITTCSSDGSVKIWNHTAISSHSLDALADDALERELLTDVALTSVHRVPASEALIAVGDEILLLDARTTKISDRKVKAVVKNAWPIRRSRAIGVRDTMDSNLQVLTLSDGDLHTGNISSDDWDQLKMEPRVDPDDSIKTERGRSGHYKQYPSHSSMHRSTVKTPMKTPFAFGGLLSNTEGVRSREAVGAVSQGLATGLPLTDLMMQE